MSELSKRDKDAAWARESEIRGRERCFPMLLAEGSKSQKEVDSLNAKRAREADRLEAQLELLPLRGAYHG